MQKSFVEFLRPLHYQMFWEHPDTVALLVMAGKRSDSKNLPEYYKLFNMLVSEGLDRFSGHQVALNSIIRDLIQHNNFKSGSV